MYEIARYWLTGAVVTWILMVIMHRYNRRMPGRAFIASLLMWPLLLFLNISILLFAAFTLIICWFFGISNKMLIDWWKDQ